MKQQFETVFVFALILLALCGAPALAQDPPPPCPPPDDCQMSALQVAQKYRDQANTDISKAQTNLGSYGINFTLTSNLFTTYKIRMTNGDIDAANAALALTQAHAVDAVAAIADANRSIATANKAILDGRYSDANTASLQASKYAANSGLYLSDANTYLSALSTILARYDP